MSQQVEVRTDFIFTNRVIGDTVYMLLNQGIGPDPKNPTASYIDGARFADEMYYWKAAGKKIVAKINTPGGRVDHGWNMVDAIIECQADTFDAGIAYSMGGICLVFGKNRKAYDFASAMIHAPRGGNKEVIDVIKGQFQKLLESRTKLSKAEIEDMMASGKDYFFTASEMLAKGLIDEIVPSNMTLTPPGGASAQGLYEFYNSFIDENQNNNDMDFKAILAKLTGKETEAEGIVAVTEMKASNESLKASLAVKEAEIADLKKKLADAELAGKATEAKAKATELIQAAVKANKFVGLKPEDEAKLIENATANFDSVKLMIDSMKPQKPAAAATFQSQERNKELSYEYLAKHDPQQLAQIAENDPELFNKLSDEYNAKFKETK